MHLFPNAVINLIQTISMAERPRKAVVPSWDCVRLCTALHTLTVPVPLAVLGIQQLLSNGRMNPCRPFPSSENTTSALQAALI